jgi:hypothetical protein
MSNKKKPKKLRTPNVPSGQGATTTVAAAPASVRSMGQPLPSPSRQMRAAPAAATQASFDYTYVKKDLSRIAVLAGSFIAILIVLSFFIK